MRLTKRTYGWPEDTKFLVPDGVYEHFQDGIGHRGEELYQARRGLFEDYRKTYPKLADQLYRMQLRELPEGWEQNRWPCQRTPFQTDTVYRLVEHLAANGRAHVVEANDPAQAVLTRS